MIAPGTRPASFTKQQKNIQRLLEKAKNAGMPRDQIQRFLAAGYVPLPWALPFHAAARTADLPDAPDKLGAGGARGPGKSHAIFAQVAIDDCQRYPGLRVLYLRKLGKAARESMDALRQKVLSKIPNKFNRMDGIIRFPNGSIIITGHFRTEADIEGYLGLEYDIIIIEEMTQLTRARIEMIRGSKRSGRPNWRPREYNSTNPGGPGHQDFKNEFVIPYRRNEEIDTRFFPSTYKDNKWIDQGYIKYLKNLTGLLGRMWRDGDWDIGAGQYFVNWNHDKHVISDWPYWPIPAHWPVWAGFDYGFGHPTSVHFFTRVNNTLYTIAEHVKPYWLPEQHAAALREIADKIGRPITNINFYAGADCFSRESNGRTIAEQYKALGLKLLPANVSRKPGAAAMLNALGNPAEGIEPSWYILDTCPLLAETMPNMQADLKEAKDVIKFNADENGEGGDDPYDSGRYGLMSAPASVDQGGFNLRSRA